MTISRGLLAGFLLATTMLAGPAFAQVPEAPNADPTAQTPLTPPQGQAAASSGTAPAADGEEVVITGRFIPNEKRETSEVVELLTQEDLQRTGDADIAAALTRVPGLSLVDGRFVYVRGLGGRYSSALLDGSVLPSPEPLRRIVPLDAFPTDLLSGALVQKTYSVEYPGEFGGGLVALRSRAVPEENFFEFGISSGINDNSTFKTGYSFKGGGFDVLGLGDETYELPQAVRTNPSLVGFDGQQLQNAGRSLVRKGPGFSIDKEPNWPDYSGDLTIGRRFDLFGLSAGLVVAVTYDNQFRNNFGVRNRYAQSDAGLTPFSQLAPEACTGYRVDQNSCGLFQTNQEITLAGITSLGIEIDAENSVKATTALLRKTDKLAEIRRGLTPINDPANLVSDQRLAFIEQELWINQLSGEHAFSGFGPFADIGVNWRGSYGRASRVTPYLTEYRYILGLGEDDFLLSPISSRNSISFTALEDDNYELGGDLKLKGDLGGMDLVLKTGALWNKKDRAYTSRRYTFNVPVGTDALRRFVPEIIFSPDNIGPGGFQLDIPTAASQANAFTASTEIWGGYWSGELQVARSVRLTAGVRYERSDQQVTGLIANTLPAGSRCLATGDAVGFTQPVACRLKQDFWLPAATATFEFADNMQLRFGVSRTLSRPDLRELSPATILDIEEDLNVVGNPELRIARVTNYDARYEWYLGRQQLFSIGAFYKDLKDPIEQTLTPFGDGNQASFLNAMGAKVYGGEVELEVNLPVDEWLGADLGGRRVFVIGNVTYAKSKVDIDPAQQGVLTSLSRRLEGQSEWLGNVQFGYDREGERAAILFNYASNRIQSVGTFGVPDVLESPPITLDFTFAKSFPVGGREIELSFKASNLLDDEFRRTQGGLIYEGYDLGRTFSLGLKTRF